MTRRIVRKPAQCACGALNGVRVVGGPDPLTDEWRFYAYCHICGNSERGFHRSVEAALEAWDKASSVLRRGSSSPGGTET